MIDYVGDCVVCDEVVDESDAGYCEGCDGVFHWARCGSWGYFEGIRGQYCENCNEGD